MTELGLLRTIVEQQECSFASQEAKLDRVLAMITSNRPQQPSKLQQPSQQPQFSTPDLNCHRQTSRAAIHSTTEDKFPPRCSLCFIYVLSGRSRQGAWSLWRFYASIAAGFNRYTNVFHVSGNSKCDVLEILISLELLYLFLMEWFFLVFRRGWNWPKF